MIAQGRALPLLERRVAIYRSAEQSQPLADAVAGLGAEPVVVPLIEVVEPADGGAALDDALVDLAASDWVVFTSANAVAAVGRRNLDGLRRHAGVAAVGAATAAALRRAGVEVAFVPSRATAATLATELPVRRGRQVLAPLAELAGPDLQEGLASRGFDVRRVDAYRLAPLEVSQVQRRAARSAEAAVITSPSIADRFVSLGLVVPGQIVVSIGPRTSAALEAAGVRGVSEADPHDGSGIVACLAAAMADRPRI